MFKKIMIFCGLIKSNEGSYTTPVDPVIATPVSGDCILSVDAFNIWFNDPRNNAVYAHSGIFLRLDKLSYSHIEDYLDKKHNIDRAHPFYNDPMFYLLLCDFQEDIRNDWIQKSK
jgi:hypothetical protein